jgi:hypothetical protein
MKNVYLFQPQYSVEFRQEPNYWIPYSAGCLWSYAIQFADIQENFELKDIIFKREPIATLVDRLDNPAFCGFSCYVWNEQYCLKVAELVKARWPDCIIQFGGPQSNSNMSKYQFIDSIIMGEGEEIFLDSLRQIIQNKPPEFFYQRKRLANLEIPSPFLTGVFDKIINNNPDIVWAMALETNRGCPYACTFCDWGGVTYSKIKKFKIEKIAEELEWAKNHRVAYIFLADANFGILKERDLEIAREIRRVLDDSIIESINIQYAKHGTDIVFEIAKTIGHYGRGISVSVQSMNELTLDAIKRTNLETNNIKRMLELSEVHGVNTYTEVIVGLPEETKETWITGLNQLLELGQHQNIDVWFAQLLPNAELASPESKKKYGITSVVAKNFMTLNTKNIEEVDEIIEIVNSTNTATTSDLVDCYIYAWMIIHFHVNGYSQLVARYARNVKNISYELFYNNFLTEIQHNEIIGQHYNELKTITTNYLTSGSVPKNFVGGWGLHSMSYKFIYDNRLLVTKLAIKCLSKLTTVDPIIENLQNAFIVNNTGQSTYNITAPYNVFTGDCTNTEYTFEPKIDIDNVVLKDFYALRRAGVIKNKVATKEII